ncbi:hypothetical protein PUNSTDRAFT_99821 [Punctularia strigosozonata HHB-11173 SS5]|uniref:uncharacterized protein n=1 Tax=Punctularia strigosozonata (strain HHB-11173) TaxID=741275 RepID=UPI0004416D23|nr:uncharacterized protein PUNSTDRAFT_99821 [Punctularia strigosozonata HHB-11173 SS5]EIN10366.1 hypothetical protein PUNSTDRAFT_99821 [Punctularia strigosozonata HHB-11173 SS5]
MVKSTVQSPVPSISAPPPAKRQKMEDDPPRRPGGASTSTAPKKPRTRVSYSCGECHRRKQKCDRQIPCSHCLARKVPELCKAYTPGKSDQDLHARVARLENIVEMAFPHLAMSSETSTTPATPIEQTSGMDHYSSTSMGAEDDSQSQNEEQDAAGGTFQSGQWYGESVSGSVAPASVLEQLQNAVASAPGPSKPLDSSERKNPYPPSSDVPADIPLQGGQTSSPAREGDLKRAGNQLNIDMFRQNSERSAADNMRVLVEDYGVSPDRVNELLHELPQQRYMDLLIDTYFQSINWTRYPLLQRDFRASYVSLCSNAPNVKPTDVKFLPLLFVILAIAVRLAPESVAGDARTRRITSQRFYWSSRRSLLIAVAVQPDSLEVILVRLLSTRFLTFDRRITECWSQLGAAVRTAQALGLHRDSGSMNIDPVQVEYRRRIWAYLYHADRSYALVLGRPNAIQDDYTSTLPPSNVEDDFSIAQIQKPPPLSHPTSTTFVILRHALAAIIGRMVHHFQQVRTRSHYSDVLTLDDELLHFISTLPPHYSLDPDTSLDETLPYIPVHRYLLITEILFVRISLHRPYLLRKLGSDRYARSRKACFESAKKDFRVRQAFRASRPQGTNDPHSNAYREFQTAMISGIYLVLEPNGIDAPEMHSILDGFLKDHENRDELDETTRREIKIIEFLKTKSTEDPREDASTIPVDPALGGSATDAQLLLELRSRPSSTAPPQPSRAAFTPLALDTSSSVTTPQMTPATPYPNGHAVYAAPGSAHSPTIRRLQAQPMLSDAYHSPSNTGSPGGDDESSAAQSLLDHWVNTVNGAAGEVAMGMSGVSWPGVDYPTWLPNPPLQPSEPITGFDGSDWGYWEALVNQIKQS